MRLFDIITKHLEENRHGALATIVSRVGATPRDAGAKLFITDDGKMFGSVGGGCVESEVWYHAKTVMTEKTGKMLRYSLNGKSVEDEGMICGGALEFFIEPVLAKHTKIYQSIAKCLESGIKALIINSREGKAFKKSLLAANGDLTGDAPSFDISEGQFEEYFKSGNRVVVTDGFIIEPVVPYSRIFIYGAGHISQHISRFAKAVGFEVIVIDDRDIFANVERFPEADEVVVEEFNGLHALHMPDVNEYAVIVTRGHKHDATVLEQVLKNPPKYGGMIGSKRKIKILFDDLRKKGFPEELLKAVHAPVGLDIGAETPEEIAISIVAELIKIRSNRI